MEEQMMTKEGMLPKGCMLANGKYRVETYLASGGFGNTYLATDTVFNEKVVVKELYVRGMCGRESDHLNISISLTENREAFTALQRRFKREATILRRLIHPNIVRVLDLFDENGTSYYVMDLVDGESLSQHMKRTGKPMTEQDVMPLLWQVLDALEAVHAASIWHLDLKPANIMLDRKGNALLIDFGASKQLRSQDGNSLSLSSALAYTPGFASPEQMEQSIERFGAWTDLYSLGATLYNLLTTHQPPSPSEIVEDAYHALCLPPSVSKQMGDLILWLMKPNRRERPQSVADVKQFLGGKPVQPSQPRPAQSPSPSPQVHKSETDDGETVMKGGKNIQEKHKQAPDTKKAKVSSKKRMGYWLAKLAAVCGVIGAVVIGVKECGGAQQATKAAVTKSGDNLILTVGDVTYKLVYVDGGTFTMGATREQGSDASESEMPTHSVTLSSYHIGETEVTQALWQAVMGSNPSSFTGDSRRPVDQVSWEDCQRFISKLNSLTGQQFHLPTEAQWEYAARGGSKSRGYKYSGSNDLGSVAWYDGNSGTHHVKTKSPNELGLYDMSGNVWEWCQDWYGSYSSGSQTNPTDASRGSYRVCRGGGWGDDAGYCRVSDRNFHVPSFRDNYLGLRLAL
ncbi:MAG: SUMF1/EgtB/PvdO family nonheme iron enzyme [Prevotella sp.]|nr:SUMF1/EgtB/PvdO family nonheme iron enzyme [Prevotella sp.]